MGKYSGSGLDPRRTGLAGNIFSLYYYTSQLAVGGMQEPVNVEVEPKASFGAHPVALAIISLGLRLWGASCIA